MIKAGIKAVIVFIITFLPAASYSQVTTDPCHLNISVWNKGKPFLYHDNNNQTGIYPDIFQSIFSHIGCRVTTVFYPPARLKARNTQSQTDLTILPRPHNSQLFIGAPKYLKGNGLAPKAKHSTHKYHLIETPIFYPHAVLIEAVKKPVLWNNSDITNKLRIGAIRVPQHNKLFWQDFYTLKETPQAYNTSLQGLKALASGRIDLFLSPYATIIQSFEAPEALKVSKRIHPLEVNIVIHQKGINTLSKLQIEKIEKRIKHLHDAGVIKEIIKKYKADDDFYWPTL